MRSDGELNRHFDKLKQEKEVKDVYDIFKDEMITRSEWIKRQDERSKSWLGDLINATP
jgi:hypothetical protein